MSQTSTPAILTLSTDWARVETSTPNTTFRLDSNFSSEVYNDVTFGDTWIQVGAYHNEKFRVSVVPFTIVNNGDPIDINVTHGRDKKRLGDKGASAEVTFANNWYKNEVANSEYNGQKFQGCAVTTTNLLPPPNANTTYNIKLTIAPNSKSPSFQPIHHPTWHYARGAVWYQSGNDWVLEIGGSGTAGALVLEASDKSERVFVVFGVHNYKPWTDIVYEVDAKVDPQTILSEYYTNDRGGQREKQLTSYTVTDSNDRTFSVNYTVKEGRALAATLSIKY